jgi:hypothetical protein
MHKMAHVSDLHYELFRDYVPDHVIELDKFWQEAEAVLSDDQFRLLRLLYTPEGRMSGLTVAAAGRALGIRKTVLYSLWYRLSSTMRRPPVKWRYLRPVAALSTEYGYA